VEGGEGFGGSSPAEEREDLRWSANASAEASRWSGGAGLALARLCAMRPAGRTEKEGQPTMLSLLSNGCRIGENLGFSRVKATLARLMSWIYFSLYSSG